MKLQFFRSTTLLKRDSNAGAFLWLLGNLGTPIVRNICLRAASVLSNSTSFWTWIENTIEKNYITRSSRSGGFCKKGALRTFVKFSWKHLCQSLFFNNVAGPRHRYFPVNFARLHLRTPFLITPLVDASPLQREYGLISESFYIEIILRQSSLWKI